MRMTYILCMVIALSGCGGKVSRALEAQEFQTPMIDPRDVRALFVGDSITFSMPIAERNRNTGIPGAGAEIIGRRFVAEIQAGKPKYVHILAGTNDVGGGRDAATISIIGGMVVESRKRGFGVIVGTVPPLDAVLFPHLYAHVKPFNEALVADVKPKGAVIADYYSAMIKPDGSQNGALFSDGIHPNQRGYLVMRQVLREARHTLRVTRRAERKAAGITRTPEQRAARKELRAEREQRREERAEKKAAKGN
jgi:hypothetical protein